MADREPERPSSLPPSRRTLQASDKHVYTWERYYSSLENTLFALICLNCPQVCFKNNPSNKGVEKYYQATASKDVLF